MSNERHEYTTGAVRSADCDAVRYDLISPIGLRALAQTYHEGAVKFGPHNWENGMPVVDLLNHAIAHIYNFLGGDRTEDHLGHAAWNLIGAIHSMEKWPHLNNGELREPNCGIPPAYDISKQDPETTAELTEALESGWVSVDPAKMRKQAAKKKPARRKKRGS